ncbi:hypothetical protein [Roseobacter sp. AzwK-3b]|uniref:hypothetical protein n=1 Tax=Roseobacter sp. AzwK-3b TaxID=351016 RepID=UPI0012F4851D|nr:hypothetical protein [Roseobacter sp. AzwK-3b]
MSKEDKETARDVAVRVDHTPTTVNFGPTPTIDLAGIPEEQRAKMLADYNNKVLDVSAAAHQMRVDSDALRATLNSLSNTTNEAAQDGNSVTITHTQETSIGRTEVIMGNTDQAKTGKLTKSQTGERDLTPYYIGGGLLAMVLIAALLGGG